jgi:hypothetical protein
MANRRGPTPDTGQTKNSFSILEDPEDVEEDDDASCDSNGASRKAKSHSGGPANAPRSTGGAQTGNAVDQGDAMDTTDSGNVPKGSSSNSSSGNLNRQANRVSIGPSESNADDDAGTATSGGTNAPPGGDAMDTTDSGNVPSGSSNNGSSGNHIRQVNRVSIGPSELNADDGTLTDVSGGAKESPSDGDFIMKKPKKNRRKGLNGSLAQDESFVSDVTDESFDFTTLNNINHHEDTGREAGTTIKMILRLEFNKYSHKKNQRPFSLKGDVMEYMKAHWRTDSSAEFRSTKDGIDRPLCDVKDWEMSEQEGKNYFPTEEVSTPKGTKVTVLVEVWSKQNLKQLKQDESGYLAYLRKNDIFVWVHTFEMITVKPIAFFYGRDHWKTDRTQATITVRAKMDRVVELGIKSGKLKAGTKVPHIEMRVAKVTHTVPKGNGKYKATQVKPSKSRAQWMMPGG